MNRLQRLQAFHNNFAATDANADEHPVDGTSSHFKQTFWVETYVDTWTLLLRSSGEVSDIADWALTRWKNAGHRHPIDVAFADFSRAHPVQ
jgi:hypothetical protein